jgi:acyl-CoA thioesterase-2
VSRVCALAYCSDDLPSDAVRSRRLQAEPDAPEGEWFGTSLDHAVWFHRPVPAGPWQLYHFTCQGLLGARGLSVGHVFDADGTLLATVAQEVLLRRRR